MSQNSSSTAGSLALDQIRPVLSNIVHFRSATCDTLKLAEQGIRVPTCRSAVRGLFDSSFYEFSAGFGE